MLNKVGKVPADRVESGPVARPQTLGLLVGAFLVVAALAASLLATMLTNRLTDDLRAERDEQIAPLERRLDRVQLDLDQLSIESRIYALSGDPRARELYEASRARLDVDIVEFQRLAADRGMASEAEELVTAVNIARTNPEAVVAARDQGDVSGALTRLASFDQANVDRINAAVQVLEQRIVEDIRRTTSDIEDADDRELLVTILAVAVGFIAATFVVWLALRNRSLAARLADDRRRVDDLIASVPGVVWEAWGRPDSPAQRFRFVSDYAEEMLGYPTRQWLQTPRFWLDMVHPEDRGRAMAEAAAIFVSGRPGQSQFRWCTRDGRTIEALTYSRTVKGGSGIPAGMRGITFDITERVRAERHLRVTAQAGAVLLSSLDVEETLQAVARLAVPDVADWCAIHLVNAAGEVEQISVSHRQPEKVRWALELQQRYPPEPRQDRGIHRVIATGEPEMMPVIPEELLVESARDEEHLRLIREVGVRSYICVPMITRGRTLGTITLITAESGRVYDDVDLSLARDLAARTAIAIDNAQLHGAVERERARFASMVDSTSLAVLQVDHAGRIEHANPAAMRLLFRQTDELLGRSIHDVVHPHHAAVDGQCAVQGLGQGGRRRSAVRDQFVRADGSVVDVEVMSAPIVVEGGSVSGAVVVIQDVTERLRQEKMKDDFIGFASHELRSPLTTINGMAKWLVRNVEQQRERFTEDEADAAAALAEGADRMRSIVELFLDLTRIDAGRFEMELQEVNYSRLLVEEAEALRMRSPLAVVAADAPATPITGFSDPLRLRQVMVNLLDNAVKYGGQPPRVHASVESSGDNVLFAVRDNGGGIAEVDQARVFDRFYKGMAVRGKGLGIGLFVSKAIVERLGGTLTFETGPEGTVFRMLVPREVRAPAPSANGSGELAASTETTHAS